jgi:hypothetical protein
MLEGVLSLHAVPVMREAECHATPSLCARLIESRAGSKGLAFLEVWSGVYY